METATATVTPPKRRRASRARRGTGMLYQLRRRDGTLAPTWWTKLHVNGRPVRESTGTIDRDAAEGVLRDRLERASQGLVIVRLNNVRFDELADDLKAHYETTGTRDVREADKRLKPLRRFFAGWRAAKIDGAGFDRYVAKRQAAGTANGTINRERSVLLKMLRLAPWSAASWRGCPSFAGSRNRRHGQDSSKPINTPPCVGICPRSPDRMRRLVYVRLADAVRGADLGAAPC